MDYRLELRFSQQPSGSNLPTRPVDASLPGPADFQSQPCRVSVRGLGKGRELGFDLSALGLHGAGTRFNIQSTSHDLRYDREGKEGVDKQKTVQMDPRSGFQPASGL